MNVSNYCNRRKERMDHIKKHQANNHHQRRTAGNNAGTGGKRPQNAKVEISISQNQTDESLAKKAKARKTKWGVFMDQVMSEYSQFVYSSKRNLRFNYSEDLGSKRYSPNEALREIRCKGYPNINPANFIGRNGISRAGYFLESLGN